MQVLYLFAVFAGDITVRVMYANYLYMRPNSVLRVSLLATLFQSSAQAQKPVGNFLYEFCDFLYTGNLAFSTEYKAFCF